MPFVLTEPSPHDARLGFTVADVRAMVAAGILEEGGKYELLDGEIVPMQAHNPPHMRLKRWIVRDLTLRLQEAHWVDSEPTFYLAGFGNRQAKSFTAPDVIVYPLRFSPEAVGGADCSLVIEVASTTQATDLGLKAQIYARHRVRDYWVCDTGAQITTIHREPQAHGYAALTRVPFHAPATPLLLPSVALVLAEAG